MASSSSTTRNWVYDVFPSFSGKDIRINFLSHFLKELDRKLIVAFKDNEIKRGGSLDPELKLAIRTSKIAVVIFSKKYASSSWCLNELLEIVKCQEEFGQTVIPVFYDLDPSHVRYQLGDFGDGFNKSCRRNTKDLIQLWRKALSHVADLLGYHSQNWDNEAKMIEDITNDVLKKLLLTTSKDSEGFVGIENHLVEMSALLHLESEEVRMVGIWGASGIGKTTIARALYNRISCRFQGRIFIDKASIYKTMKIYDSANPDDYNMKLHLQTNFLSKILKNKEIDIDHLGAVEERLKHQKVLIFIDDLNDHVVLDALVGQTRWFGRGSRIIVITKDKHLLRAHRIVHIYEVRLPSKELALEMFCRSAFRQNYPPKGLMEFASEVTLCAGYLPLGINVLGSHLRGRDKEELIEMLPSLRDSLNGKIEKTLKVSYDGLNNKKDEALFRHIACLFNGESVNDIKLLLADSDLHVNVRLKSLVDKSLIHIREWDTTVEMHDLVQDMGKEIVRGQSPDPGEREFLVDSKEICEVLKDNIGTRRVLGLALDMDEIDELHIHEDAFKGMNNLLFLKFYNTKEWGQKKEVRWHLPENFNYWPHKLRLLRLDRYPMRYMPSKFRPDNLVKLQMQDSKLEKLWEGVHSLAGLREMDLQGSRNLEVIPNLSMATNLEALLLNDCSGLVELTSSIKYLNKLNELDMSGCRMLETLPSGINLQSLDRLDFSGCSRLKIFPNISTNISMLNLDETSIDEFSCVLHLKKLNILSMRKTKTETLWGREQPQTPLIMTMVSPTLERLFLSDIKSLVELPSSIQNFSELKFLEMIDCINLETLPKGINFQNLYKLDFTGCIRLKTFPDLSTKISSLHLGRTGIEEVPWWIEKFSKLEYFTMNGCESLQCVSLHISKLKHLEQVDFSDCSALTKATWSDSSSDVVEQKDNNEEASHSFPDNFINCFIDLDHQGNSFFKYMYLSGEEVPSYFTHRTTGTSSSLTIPIIHTSLSQPFFRFKACAVVDSELSLHPDHFSFDIHVSYRFNGGLGDHFDDSPYRFYKNKKGIYLVIFEFSVPLNEDNALTGLSYDHVDIQFHLSDSQYYSVSTLKGWGIRLVEECSSSEIGYGPNICEVEEENMVNEGCHVHNNIGNGADQSEELCGENDDSVGSASDHHFEECENSDDYDIGSENEQFEECEDIDGFDTNSETDHFEDCEDSD